MSYQDLGYDGYFDASLVGPSQEVQTIDSAVLLEGIDASNILSDGTITSSSERVNLDLSEEVFSVSDGIVERVRLGKTTDGEYGLIIKDQDGNEIFNITGSKNLIQSASQRMQLDFTNNQARWYDTKNLRVLIGDFL